MRKLIRRLPRRVQQAYHAVRYRVHPGHRYHIVHTGLKPGYYDQDVRMLHACFALLVDYVNESGGEQSIKNHTAELCANPEEWFGGLEHGAALDLMRPHIDKNIEVLALYRWWTVIRPANQARETNWCNRLYADTRNRDYSTGDSQALWEFQDALIEDDQAMLIRLITIRGSLWV